MNIKFKLKNTIKFLLPQRYHLTLIYLYRKLKNSLDYEMIYVDKILNKKRCFIDIGANVGIYSYYYMNKFEKIIAFEPLIKYCKLESLKSKKITVYNCAISDKQGETILYTPIKESIEIPSNSSLNKTGGEFIKNLVKLKKLDEFNLRDVDLIKIDVEGHESKVLNGALNTIKKNRPILIIEIEYRHNHMSINKIFEMITSLKYDGFFFKKKKLLPISNFSLNVDQKQFLKNNVPMKGYINNFIFTPKK